MMKKENKLLLVLIIISVTCFFSEKISAEGEYQNNIEIDTLPNDFQHLVPVDFQKNRSTNYTLYIDSWGYVWVGTEDGAYCFNGNEFVHFKCTESKFIDKIYEDIEGNMVFMWQDEVEFILERKKRNDPNHSISLPSEQLLLPMNLKNSESKNEYMFIAGLSESVPVMVEYSPDSNNELYGTTTGKIYWKQEKAFQTTLHILDTEVIDGIVDMEFDASGALWILNGNRIWYYRPDRPDLVNSIFDTPRGAFWKIIGHPNDSSKYTLENRALRSNIWELSEPPKLIFENLPIDGKDFSQNEDGNFLLTGFAGSVLNTYDYPRQTVPTEVIPNGVIESTIPLFGQNKLIAIRDSEFGGIGILDSAYQLRLPHFRKNSIIRDSLKKLLPSAYYIYKDGNQDFWVSALDKGHLVKLRFDKDTLIDIKSFNIIKNGIITFYFEPNKPDSVWIGSQSKGLIHYDLANDSMLQQFDGRDGMISEKIYSIQSHGNDIWFYSQSGLGCLLSKDRDSISFLGLPDGLGDLDGAGTSSFQESGKIFFGTDSGLIWFHADSLADHLRSRFQMAEKRGWQIALMPYNNRIPFDFDKHTVVREEGNSLSFDLTGFDFKFSDLLTYRYAFTRDSSSKIQEWKVYEPIDKMIRFPGDSLSYGIWYLIVEARSDGNWKRAKTIRIINKKPLYKEWWLWFSISLLLLFGYYLVYFYAKNKKREQDRITNFFNKTIDTIFSTFARKSLVNLEEILGFYADLFDKYDINPYVFAFTVKNSDDYFHIYKYRQNGEWKDDGKVYPLEDTFNGYAYKNGKEVIVTNLNDRRQLQKYVNKEDAKFRDKSFAGKAESLVCIPIFNEQKECIATLSLQFEEKRQFSNDEIRFLYLLAEFLPKVYIVEQLNRPGAYFLKGVKATYNSWMENPDIQADPFHSTYVNKRPLHYGLVDYLLKKNSEFIDQYFQLSTDGYFYDDHPVNLIFKGLAGRSPYENTFSSERSSITLGGILLMFTAAFERNSKAPPNSSLRQCWRQVLQQPDETLNDTFRYYNFRRSPIIPPDDIYQAAFDLAKTLLFRKDEPRLLSCSINTITIALKLKIRVDNAENLINRFERHRAGYGDGGNTSKALNDLDRLLRERSMDLIQGEKNDEVILIIQAN